MKLPTGWSLGEFVTAVGLILVAIGLAAAVVIVSAQRQLTPLESAFMQIGSLVAGFVGSYIFGKHSARAAAQEMIKPAARSAFRRAMWLYGSLSRLGQTLSGSNQPGERVMIASAIVAEQLTSAQDSMEDWRDLVPEEVAEVERRLNGRSLALRDEQR